MSIIRWTAGIVRRKVSRSGGGFRLRDRRERIVAMMEQERVAFRFSDGVRVTDAQIEPQEIAEVGRAGFKEVGSFAKYLRGMVGCRRAHLRVLEKAHAAGLESLLIFEDDAHLTEKWLTRYRAALKELPTGWHQLYLSAIPFRRSAPFSTTLWRIASAYQTTAILYSKQGIEIALQCLHRSRSEIDLMDWYRNRRTIPAKRWFFAEWDGWCGMPLREYLGEVWDADVSVSSIRWPNREPEWFWFRQIQRLPEKYRPFACGMVPTCFTCVSDRAMQALSERLTEEMMGHIIYEIRIPTLIHAAGMPPVVNPRAGWNVGWNCIFFRRRSHG